MKLSEWLYGSIDRMVVFTFTCGALSAAGCALDGWHARSAFGTLYWGLFLLMVAGFLLMFFAASRLRHGVQNERWPLEQVEGWRSRTQSRLWSVALAVGVLLMIATLFGSILQTASTHQHTPLYWACFIGVQTFSQVTSAFRTAPTRLNGAGMPVWRDWRTFPKLTSDRWGER